MSDSNLQRTPLYESHIQNGGKMVDFSGWELPIHYGSQIQEHEAVRTDAGMFDVSHMLVTDVVGKDSKKWLQKLIANDVAKLTVKGKALYTAMLNDEGGIIDDLIVYRTSEDETTYRIVSNGATREKDSNQFKKVAEEFEDVTLTPRYDVAMIAIQGPKAIEKFGQVYPDLIYKIQELGVFQGTMFDNNWFVSKTGYTGEDGIEAIVPANDAPQLFESLKNAGVKPCGLGARDTLRLEAGMNLYGHDMDDNITPWECGMAWTLALKDNRDFVGRQALEEKKDQVKFKQVGLLLEDKGVLRDGMTVLVENQDNGVITSGSFSPTLKQSIAIARVPKEAQDHVQVDVRGKALSCRVLKLPFVRHGQKQFD